MKSPGESTFPSTNLTFIGEVLQLRVPLYNYCIGRWNDSVACIEF